MSDNTFTDKDVAEWQRKIDLALSCRRPTERKWDRVLGYLEGEYFEDTLDQDRICVNMVYPHVRVVIPAIYSRNPDVTVSPGNRGKESDYILYKRAQVMQNLLRYYLRELKLKQEVKLCILDAVLTGLAWIKTGFESTFEEYDEEVVSEAETTVSSVLRKLGMKEQPTLKKTVNYQTNEKVVAQSVWGTRVSPYDLITPMLSRRPEELPWIAERIIEPIEDTLNNPRFAGADIKPSTNAQELLSKLRGQKYDTIYGASDVQYVIRYEIWHRESQCIYDIAEGNAQPLCPKHESEYTYLDSGYHPYVTLRFNELVDQFYPQSDIDAAEPQLEELNTKRTQINTHTKRYNRMWGTKPGALDNDAKNLLRAGEDATVIELTSQADGSVADNIAPLAPAAMPAEVFAMEQKVKDDINNILGTQDYISKAGGGARTATEASIIATQSRFKVEERIDTIGEFVGQILRNWAMMSLWFMDQMDVSEIVGLDAVYWEQVKDVRKIRKEYLLKINYASSAPINKEVKTEQFLKFYAFAKDDPYYDQLKLRIELAKELDRDDPESYLNPKVAEILEKQRVALAIRGGLLPVPQTLQNSPQSTSEPGRVPSPTSAKGGISGDPRASSNVSNNEPEIPGGKGGTALARKPY